MFADYAFDYFLQKGYTPQAAAAAVGAFQQESGMDLDPLAVHDNGTGMGIAGWRDEEPGKGRKTNLLNWAEGQGLDPNDIDTQLGFFDYEITEGDERDAGDLLRNASTLEDAAAAMVHYERPQGYDRNDVTLANGYDNRLANAQSLLESFTGNDALLQDTSVDMDFEEPDLEPVPELEDDEQYEAQDLEGEEPTTRERFGKALFNAGQKMRDQASEPLDTTPGGENMEVDDSSYSQGIPVDDYKQYTSLYQDGGVVGETMSVRDYFKMIGVL